MALAEIKVFHAAREAASLREWLPVTRDILLRLPAHLDQRSHREATLYSAYCLAYASFLRIGESIWEVHKWAAGDRDLASWHAAQRSITFDFKVGHPDRLSFILPTSKTNPLRQGVTIITTAADDHAHTVSAFHLLFIRWPSPPETHLFTLYHHDPDCVCTVLLRPTGLSTATQWSMHYVDASHRPEFQAAIRVTLSVEELPLQPEWRVSQITTFSHWVDGAQTHISAILRSTPNTSTVYHAASNFTPPTPNPILPLDRPSLGHHRALSPTVAVWGI